jgi:hypothetical protein
MNEELEMDLSNRDYSDTIESNDALVNKWVCPECGSTNPPYRETLETVRFKRMCILDKDGIIDGYDNVYDTDCEDIEADYICCSDCEWYKEIT